MGNGIRMLGLGLAAAGVGLVAIVNDPALAPQIRDAVMPLFEMGAHGIDKVARAYAVGPEGLAYAVGIAKAIGGGILTYTGGE